MKNETKLIRIRLSSWRKVRRAIKVRKNETFADYMDRVLHRAIE